MSKLDITPVLKAHVKTLRDERNNKLSAIDLIIFFLLPFTCAAIVLYLHFGFHADAVNGFLNSFAIFTGLLLNVLILVFTLASSSTPLTIDPRKRKEFLRRVFVNVSFSVVTAIAVVVVAVIALSYMRSNQGAITGPIATFFLVFLTANFVLTLLMIVKQMFILLGTELDRVPIKQDRAA